MKIHHIGIACRDISATLAEVRKYHDVIDVSGFVDDDLQKAKLCYVKTKEGLDLELISGPQVQGVLKTGGTYYHICYTVGNLDETVRQMVDKGAILVSPPKPAKLFSGSRVAFLFLSHGLMELLEEPFNK